jgi:8-oxo-dGTP pyrophosphatase MutT (NUDIX family)
MSITGAGIFIVEDLNGIKVATLFGNWGGVYSEPGGIIDMSETPEQCACRETQEETANMLSLEPHELSQIAVKVVKDKYVSYIVYLKNLSDVVYYQNVFKIFGKCDSHVWKETNSMVRIPLQDLINTALAHKEWVRDINGLLVQVRGRTLGIVRNFVNVFSTLQNPIILNQNYVLNNKMRCLIGTSTYTTKQYNPIYPYAWPIQRQHKYAIYVVPNLVGAETALHKCDARGGLHVTLVDFSDNHPSLKMNLKIINQMGSIPWKMDPSTIRINNNTIFFSSGTINTAANILRSNTFQKVMGLRYSNMDWHISFNCVLPLNIVSILSNCTWSYVIVRMNDDGTYIGLEQYMVNRLK